MVVVEVGAVVECHHRRRHRLCCQKRQRSNRRKKNRRKKNRRKKNRRKTSRRKTSRRRRKRQSWLVQRRACSYLLQHRHQL